VNKNSGKDTEVDTDERILEKENEVGNIKSP